MLGARTTPVRAVGICTLVLATVSLPLATGIAQAAPAPFTAPATASAPAASVLLPAAVRPTLPSRASLALSKVRAEAGAVVTANVQVVPATKGFRVSVQRSWNRGRTWVADGAGVTAKNGKVAVRVSTSKLGVSLVRAVVAPLGRYKGTVTRSVAFQVVAWKPGPVAPVAGPVGRVISSQMFGMHPLSGSPTIPVGTIRLWDTATHWASVEPSDDGWSWGTLDAQVDAAQAAGRTVLLPFGGTPQWAGSGTPAGAPTEHAGLGTASPPVDVNEYREYVRAVITRYRARNPGVITAYQPWNEANIPNYWRGTPRQMAQLTKIVYDAVQSIDPAATVVAASTGTRWVSGYRAFYPAYLEALKALRWPVEAFSAHMYPLVDGRNAARAQLIGMVQQSLRGAGAPSLPLWDTELNYGLNGANSIHFGAADSATLVARSYLDSLRFGVERVYWYAWMPPFPLLGIDMWTGTPGAQAHTTTYGWLVGQVFRGCTQTGVVVTCSFSAGSTRSVVAWAERASGPLRVPAGMTRVQQLDGSVGGTRPGATLVVGSSPVRVS